MNANTGGPAFPQPNHTIVTDRGREEARGWMSDSGMTLLDWYAGQALAGLCSSWYDRYKYDPETQRGHGPALISQSAYTHAEAMLAEKARREAIGKESLTVKPREVDNERWARFQDGIRITWTPTAAWCAEIRDGSMGYGDTIAEAVANLRARWEERRPQPVVQESSTTDHSPDAGKMVWKQSPNMNGAIICETQFSAMHADDENVEAYGGFLVAESVPEEAKALIIRAPQLEAANRELVEFVERLAAFPLEEFGWQSRKDSQPIHGWNDYTLYVSDIKRARNLLAKHKGVA